MKLTLFDCDNTLWKIPYKENDDFMKNPISVIDYNFELNKPVIKEYFKAKGNGDIIVALTNRHVDTEKVILNKLKRKNITFDYTLFRKTERSKGKRLRKFLENHTEITEVIFWDDKQRHLDDVKRIEKYFPLIQFKTKLAPQTKDMLEKISEEHN